MADFFDEIAETIRLGRRRQDPYDPSGYQYYWGFADLPDGNTHLVVCVRFRWRIGLAGAVSDEKFVTTAYMQAFKE